MVVKNANSYDTILCPKRADAWLRSSGVMAQYMLGTMWTVSCIRKCVGVGWVADGRCRSAEAGDALDADGLVEMPSCLWVEMLVVYTAVGGWTGWLKGSVGVVVWEQWADGCVRRT